MARPIVSVIISAKNEAARLESCFASLAAQKSRYPFEVHVVDNNSTDGTYALARKLARNAKRPIHVWKEKKPGSPAARNHGAKKALGKILLFTDADCSFHPKWVEEMAKPLLQGRRYPLAALGGRTESAYAGAAPNLWERYLDELFRFWEEDRISAFPAFLPWAPTCNLAVTKEAFQAVGGFDEKWRIAAYDVDLCWRLVMCGFVFGHAPRAEVRHLRRSSLRGLLRQIENYAFYNHSLIATYERLLGLSKVEAKRERLAAKARRAAQLLRATRTPAALTHRAIDALAQLSALKGGLEARVAPARPDPKLHATRRGETPEKLLRQLPRGYAHLHKQGWCYWQDPADVDADGELMLFLPRKKEWFRLNDSAWKIWEVKSEGGQSEDAAHALGQEENAEILRDIDELTLDLRTRRLLP